jgi:long-subunit fatty acid transport protein
MVLLFLSLPLVAPLGFTQSVLIGSAQSVWNVTGAGARAEGLGGAFIGIADDATAISWNPSGLGQLDRTEVSVVGRWIEERYGYEVTTQNGNSGSEDATLSHLTYNFASIAFPLHAGKTSVVPAVAYQRQTDNYYRLDDESASFEGNGGANTLTAGAGLKLHPMLYVGGTVNIWLGSYDDLRREKSAVNWLSEDGTYGGINYTVGFLVDFDGMKKPVPIKLGAALRTPFELEVDGDVTSEDNTGRERWKFVNTVEMPLMVGVGASGRIGENLTLSVDYETRLYSDKNVYKTKDGIPSDTVRLSAGKSDLNQVRVGAEYLIVTSIAVIPIRVGFRTAPTLRADRSAQSGWGDQVVGTGFTLGAGFVRESFAFDVTYARTTTEQRYLYTSATGILTNTTQAVSTSLIVYF